MKSVTEFSLLWLSETCRVADYRIEIFMRWKNPACETVTPKANDITRFITGVRIGGSI